MKLKIIIGMIAILLLVFGCSSKEIEEPIITDEPVTPAVEPVEETNVESMQGTDDESEDVTTEDVTETDEQPVEESDEETDEEFEFVVTEPVEGDEEEPVEETDQETQVETEESESSSNETDEYTAQNYRVISLKDLKAYPEEVTITPGTTVEWRNINDNLLHIIGWRGQTQDGVKPEAIRQGESWSHTFTEVGEISWFSTARPTIQGKIYIQDEE